VRIQPGQPYKSLSAPIATQNSGLQLVTTGDLNRGLAIVASALDRRPRDRRRGDCSHLVNAIYKAAGFPYPYSKSSDLFRGISSFVSVDEPETGDLIVWRGHVGIVINPAEHSFYSSLRSGLGVEQYDSPYWVRKGAPRFYRYALQQQAGSVGDIASLHRAHSKRFSASTTTARQFEGRN